MKQLKIIYRSLKRNTKLTVIIVFCMALGLTATGIILSYVYQEYNYDCENLNADRIHRVIPGGFGPLAESLKSNYPEIEEAVRVSFFYGYLACSAGETKINENSAIFADPEFFELFSFPLTKGNSKECLRAPNAVVISDKAAQKYYGNDDPIGKILRIGNMTDFVVTGVFQDFKDNSNFTGDLVLPLEKISKLTQIWVEPSWKHGSDIHTFVLIESNADVVDLAEKVKYHVANYIGESKIELLFQPLNNIHVNNQLYWESSPPVNVKYLYVLLVVGFLILGISLANFLFLYIGTSAQRAIGIGIKKVFGASKTMMFKEYFREVLFLMGISIVVAIILFSGYHSVRAPYFSFLPKIVLLDYRLVILLTTISVVVAIIAGIYPSIVLSSLNPVTLFRRQKTSKPGSFKLLNLVVVVQFTLCIALLISAITMNKQTHYMLNRNTGYASQGLITIPLNMQLGYGIRNDRFDLFAQELKTYSGIKDVSPSFSSPSSVNTSTEGVSWEGKQENGNMDMTWTWESISFDYFETIGVKIKQGRSFSREFTNDQVNWDTRRCAYIINESAVKEMGIHDPVGKEFEVWGFRGPIIGIVEDYNFKSMHSGIGPLFYQMSPTFWNNIIIRIDPTVKSTFEDIETVWNKFVVDFPLEINYVDNQILALYRSDQDLAKTLSMFSLLAIFIASMGLFTLSVLSLNQRTKEIGIRKINGAKIHEIMTMLIRDYSKLVGIAFIIAIPIAWYVMSIWLGNFANKTNLSWWIFALSGLLVLGIALVTVSWKSWQASTRNPVESLRYK